METDMRVPMSSPDITAQEITLVNQVLYTPYLSMGPMLERFEAEVARYVGTKHAVGVSSGTAGLHLCIRAVGVGCGDAVITTPFSFVASANCILYERAMPVFVDIEPRTLNIDVLKLEEKIWELKTKNWKLKAILPVHVFGQPCEMDGIMELARRYDLVVIEDACEALGAEYKGRKIGTFSHAAVFAFYPNKQMTTGEGGIIVTDRDEWARLFQSLRNQGRDENGTWLNHVRLGYNYRLDELSAALGVAQMKRIEGLLAKREKVAEMYNQRLRSVEGVQVPHLAPYTTRMSWFIYLIRLAPELDRNQIMAKLEERGISSRPYFVPIHLQPFYVERFGYVEGDFPVTEQVAKSTLALPFYGNLEEEKVDYICRTLREIIVMN